jgi:hypothetical protein
VPDECRKGRKEVMRMRMNGSIMSAELNDFLILEANLFDHDEMQTYKGEIVGGVSGLEELLKLKKQALKKPGSVTEEQLEEAAAQVAEPPMMQPLSLRVRRVKANKAGFMTLVCSLEQ